MNQPRGKAWVRLPLSKVIAVGLVLSGVVAVATIWSLPANVEPIPPAEPVPVNVTVQTVEPVPELADTFKLTGIVQPRTVVQVAAEVSGRIEAYGKRMQEINRPGGVLPAGSPIAEGQPVTEGDPLVILNRDLIQARYDRVAAQFEHDEHEYQRILGLYERGSASPNELRRAQRTRDVSKAELDEARNSLERTTIVAPTNGILNTWGVEVGEYASPGQPVAEIVDIDAVKVSVDVPERDIRHLRVGHTAEITPLASESEPVTGTVTYINALADEATRTTRVEVTVDNRLPKDSPAAADGREYRLRSGQIVNVQLVRRVLEDAIMIPLDSVIPLEEGTEVYVVNSGKAQRRPVEIGFIRGRNVQAVSGLQPGERLIVAGHRLVSPGQPVNVIVSSQ